jgi:spore maturation protein CgeB
MKILVPGVSFEDSFIENVVVTLRRMGHEVLGLGTEDYTRYWSLTRNAWRVISERLRGDRPGRQDLRLLRLAKEFKPDLVLATTGHVHPDVLHELGRIGRGRRAIWWGDPPANIQRWGILDPNWDAVFIKNPETVAKLRLVGRNAHLLHEAMNPQWHRVMCGQSNDRVVVAGNWYAFRQALVVRLMQDGVEMELHGAPPPRWAHPDIKRHHSARYVVKEEKSRAFGAGLACLNTFSLVEGNALNCRAFEVAGAGGLQLMEWREVISDCFEPGREVLVFSKFDEFL